MPLVARNLCRRCVEGSLDHRRLIIGGRIVRVDHRGVDVLMAHPGLDLHQVNPGSRQPPAVGMAKRVKAKLAQPGCLQRGPIAAREFGMVEWTLRSPGCRRRDPPEPCAPSSGNADQTRPSPSAEAVASAVRHASSAPCLPCGRSRPGRVCVPPSSPRPASAAPAAPLPQPALGGDRRNVYRAASVKGAGVQSVSCHGMRHTVEKPGRSSRYRRPPHGGQLLTREDWLSLVRSGRPLRANAHELLARDASGASWPVSARRP